MDNAMPLLEFCETRTQEETIAIWYQCGCSARKTATETGKNRRSIDTVVNRVKQNASKRGYDPDHHRSHVVPANQSISGYSDLIRYPEDDPMGRVIGWVKSNNKVQKEVDLLREAVEGMKDDVVSCKPVKRPKSTLDSLCNLYVLTDYHLGMMSWHEETGEDYDLKIAETLLLKWFAEAIQMAPAAHTGILANIGDFMHWDGLDAVTPASKHLLDADTRFQKLVRVAIRALRTVINMMLEKHQKVVILMCDANHDPASEAWLREFFASHYENDKRVVVDNSAQSYYCFEWGDTSLFFHHGHRKKPDSIDDVFVSKFREVFGRTKFSYAHMGHMHHIYCKETNLMIVEQHRTLAAKDAYAASHGYMAGRDAKVITYHNKYGEVSRLTITPEMLQ